MTIATIKQPLKIRSLPITFGTNGTPVFWIISSYSVLVGFLPHHASWLGIFVDAFCQYQPQMKAQQRNDQPGNDENVQREKSGQRFAGDGGSSQHEVDQLRADEAEPGP